MHRRTVNAPNLPRGQACMHCRRRKMRCDGARPICGPCSRAHRVDDCQYSDSGRSYMEMLEETIAKVEARIHELENPDSESPPVLLHHPYPISESQLASGGNDGQWWSASEPPMQMRAMLIDSFLAHASEFGFFLHAPRFRQSALGQHSIGDPSRPLPALLSTAYLFGAALSGNAAVAAHHGTLLSRALAQVATSLSGNHPQKVMHTVQAEFLLAYFLFSSGRFLEGKYHVSVAISLSVGAGLHKIRSSDGRSSAHGLAPPHDPIEEGERIDACWTGLIIDQCWAVALAAPSNLTVPTIVPGTQTDTPWPLEVEDYERGGFAPNVRSSFTIQTFLKSGRAMAGNEYSTKALLSKAALLWERSNECVSNWKAEMNPAESNQFYASFNTVDKLLEELRNSLTPPTQLTNRTAAKMRALFLAHSVTYAAIIQLHGIFARSNAQCKQKVMSAAKTVFRMVCSVNLGSMTQIINPVIGAVWTSASQFLLEEIAHHKNSRAPTTQPSSQEQDLVAIFENGLREIMPLGRHSLLLKYQIQRIQEAYSVI
ncbi:hypothetical protein CPB85DRAFT_1252432 [Mucidula mucida]|nr:hypothetical protein CPB85DRAFT_1252432 [Mucidula mucida]